MILILFQKKYNSVRIGISAKQNRKIAIMAKDREGNTIIDITDTQDELHEETCYPEQLVRV